MEGAPYRALYSWGVPFLASKFRLDIRSKQSIHSILVFISLLGEIDQQNSILVFVISFCPCLIFVGKTGAYSIGGSLIWGSILMGGSFPCFQIQTRHEASHSDKHASLQFKKQINALNIFIVQGPTLGKNFMSYLVIVCLSVHCNKLLKSIFYGTVHLSVIQK